MTTPLKISPVSMELIRATKRAEMLRELGAWLRSFHPIIKKNYRPERQAEYEQAITAVADEAERLGFREFQGITVFVVAKYCIAADFMDHHIAARAVILSKEMTESEKIDWLAAWLDTFSYLRNAPPLTNKKAENAWGQ